MTEYAGNASFQVEPNLAARLAAAKEDVWFRIGVLQSTMNDRERALNAFERVLAVNPNNVRAMTQAGAVLAKKECYSQAVVYLQKAIAADSNYGEAWAVLAHCYVMSDELQKAYEAYQSALSHLPNPRDPNLWYGIGLLYDRYGSLDNALEAFLAVLTISPDFERADEVCFCIGIIYKEQQNFDEALKYFNKVVIAASPPPPLTRADGWYQIGHVNELKRDIPAAFERYKQALVENPKHPKTLQNIGWLEHQHNQNSNEAIRLLKLSADLDAGDGQTWYLLGRVYMEKKEFRQAYDAYQQAVYRDGRNATFWCSIGVLYYQMNQYRDAMDAYARAIKLNPRVSEVWYDLGTLYESCNQNDDAIDAYRKAAELAPENPQITNRLNHLEASMQGVQAAQPLTQQQQQQLSASQSQQLPNAPPQISQLQPQQIQQPGSAMALPPHPSQHAHLPPEMNHVAQQPHLPPQLNPPITNTRMRPTIQQLPAPPGPDKLLQAAQMQQQQAQAPLQQPPMPSQLSHPSLPSQPHHTISQQMPIHSTAMVPQQQQAPGPSNAVPLPMRANSMMAPIPSMHHTSAIPSPTQPDNQHIPFPSDPRAQLPAPLAAVHLPAVPPNHLASLMPQSQPIPSQQPSAMPQQPSMVMQQPEIMSMPRGNAMRGNALPALAPPQRPQELHERSQQPEIPPIDITQQQQPMQQLRRLDAQQQLPSPISSVANQSHSPRMPAVDSLHQQQSPHPSANQLPSMRQATPPRPLSPPPQQQQVEQPQTLQQQQTQPLQSHPPIPSQPQQQQPRPHQEPVQAVQPLPQMYPFSQPQRLQGDPDEKNKIPPLPSAPESRTTSNVQESRTDRQPSAVQSDPLRRMQFEQPDNRNDPSRLPKLPKPEPLDSASHRPSDNRDQQPAVSQPTFPSAQSIPPLPIAGLGDPIPPQRDSPVAETNTSPVPPRSMSMQEVTHPDPVETVKSSEGPTYGPRTHGEDRPTELPYGPSCNQTLGRDRSRIPGRLVAVNTLPAPAEKSSIKHDSREDAKLLHSIATPTLTLPPPNSLPPMSDSDGGRSLSSPTLSGPSGVGGSSGLNPGAPALPPLSTRSAGAHSGDGKDLPPTPSAPSSSLTKFGKAFGRTPATPVNNLVAPSSLPSPLPTTSTAAGPRPLHSARSPRPAKPSGPPSFKSVPVAATTSNYGQQLESVPSPSSLPVLPALSTHPGHHVDEHSSPKDKMKTDTQRASDDAAPDARTKNVEQSTKEVLDEPKKTDDPLPNKPVYGILRSQPAPLPDTDMARREHGEKDERMRSPGHSSSGRADAEKIYPAKRENSARDEGQRTAKRPRLADPNDKDNGPSPMMYDREERGRKINDETENRGNGALKNGVSSMGKDEVGYKDVKMEMRSTGGSPNSEADRPQRRDSGGGRSTDAEASKGGSQGSQAVIDLPRLPNPIPKLSSPLRIGGNNSMAPNTPLPSFLGERMNLSASRSSAASSGKGSSAENRGPLPFLRSAPVTSMAGSMKSLGASSGRGSGNRSDFGLKSVSEDKGDASLHGREESGNNKHVANGDAQKSN